MGRTERNCNGKFGKKREREREAYSIWKDAIEVKQQYVFLLSEFARSYPANRKRGQQCERATATTTTPTPTTTPKQKNSAPQ